MSKSITLGWIVLFSFVVTLFSCSTGNQLVKQNYRSNYLSQKVAPLTFSRVCLESDSSIHYKFSVNLNPQVLDTLKKISLRVGYQSKGIESGIDTNYLVFNIYRLDFEDFSDQEHHLTIQKTHLHKDKVLIQFRLMETGYTIHDLIAIPTEIESLALKNTQRQWVKTPWVFRNAEYHSEQSVTFNYYAMDHPIAPPPFSMRVPEPVYSSPDSSWESQAIIPLKLGVYQVVGNNNTSRTLLSVDQPFPVIHKVEQMVGPLRYITTKSEYEMITSSKDIKATMDSLWLDMGNSSERAKRLIKEFYRRVEFANRNFSTYKEGWKTDRGMIYIIFGRPDIVYQKEGLENWIYGQENNLTSVSMFFKHTKFPNGFKDYVLNRSSLFKAPYFYAVDSWRQGRILNTD